MAMGTETREARPNESSGRDDHEFIVIEGMVVVATIMADCIECAWNIRDRDYSGCRVAHVADEGLRYPDRRCMATVSLEESTRRRYPDASEEQIKAFIKWWRSPPKMR